jgi:glycosyltransferase involved in cell wall biosynthesis
MGASLGLALYEPLGINRECVGPASMKLFEYAARGIPVIVPAERSFAEFLKSESWVTYADPTNPVSIAQAIDRTFRDRAEYERMCYAARLAFEERFNYERVFAPVVKRVGELTSAASKGPGD